MEVQTVEAIKNLCEAFEAFLTGAGIIGGGLWVFFQFNLGRIRYPRASIKHEIFHTPLIPGKRLVRVAATVSNHGHVLLPITHVWTKTYKIFPVDPQLHAALATNQEIDYEDGTAEIKWPELDCLEIKHERGNAEIEPGEFERFEFDFMIDATIEKIFVYTFFKNPTKNGPGWSLTTFVDLQGRNENVYTPATTE